MKRFLYALCLLVAVPGWANVPQSPFRRLASGDLPANVEHLTGERAAKHLANLKSRHRGAIERAAADLRRRGLRDTGRVDVVRTTQQVGFRPGAGRTRSFSLVDTAAGAEGEIVYWAWDDGDYSTWEGMIYLNEYSSGTWIAANCQTSLVEGQEWNLIWDQVIDAGGGGVDIDREIRTVSMSIGSRFARRPAVQRAAINWPEVHRRWQDWAWCASAGCAGGTARCYLLPGTPKTRAECAAISCIGVGVGCLLVLKR